MEEGREEQRGRPRGKRQAVEKGRRKRSKGERRRRGERTGDGEEED